MAMNLELKKFDMKQIGEGGVVALIGRRNTGKSFLCRDILYNHRDIHRGQVISETEEANPFYTKFVPELFIYKEFKSDIIQNLFKIQKLMLKKMNTGEICDPRSFLILDDCSWKNDKSMEPLFMNGYHHKILSLLTIKYALDIPPRSRSMVDYVFILRDNCIYNRKRLYENYASMFPTFEMFCQVMDQCTENYECLVINNNTKTNELSDQIFWYKAESHPDFRIGADSYWIYSKNNFSNEPPSPPPPPPPQPTEEECIICLEDVPLDNGMWVKCIKCTNTICKRCKEQLTHIKCTICREMNSYVPRIF